MVEEKTLASALGEMAVINLESGDLASAMQYAKKLISLIKTKTLHRTFLQQHVLLVIFIVPKEITTRL